MIVPVVKKYVKALQSSCGESALEGFAESIKKVASAFLDEKFRNIILSPDVSQEEKEKLIISFLDNDDAKLSNFIKILSLNDKLNLLPSIADEMEYQISLKNNSYKGKLISNFALDAASISQISERMGRKFNSNIELENLVTDYSGIKIKIDDLGVEVSFSLDRLKSQMAEHIFKAI